ncbi:MAG: O-antigen ligase family protein [Saonia sp.]
MNAITHYHNIYIIGKYGKLFIAVLGVVILQKSFGQLNDFVAKNNWLLFFWGLCVLFTLVRIWEKGFDLTLIQNNILFILFIYFFYLLSLAFKIKYGRPNYYFFKYLSYALNVNLLFWTVFAILYPFTMWHTLEGRTGLGLFYENYIQLGIFACVGAITHLTLFRYKIKKDQKIYFVMFILYTALVILSNSRNSQLILFIFILFNLFPYFKKITLKYIYLLVCCAVILFAFYFSSEILLMESLTDLTTGRTAIWYYVFEYFSQNTILLGEGIFGLNNTILENNSASNYYFQRLDVLYFHSSYMEIFSASGIIGFICFILFIIRSLRRKKRFFLVTILISILIGGLFESFLVQPTILVSFLFWYLIVARTEVLAKRQPLKLRNNPIR